VDGRTITAKFSRALTARTTYQVTVTGVEDLQGTAISTTANRRSFVA